MAKYNLKIRKVDRANFDLIKDGRKTIETRAAIDEYRKIKRGRSFIVFKRSKPLFRISPVEEGRWEEVIDFTKIKNGGVNVKELLRRL
jgi:ASC-1-like (ASCH) protein